MLLRHKSKRILFFSITHSYALKITRDVVVQNSEVRLTCGKYNTLLISACENYARAIGLYIYS